MGFTREKRQYLNVLDIFLLTLFFFAYPIFSSTQAYLQSLAAPSAEISEIHFTEVGNWWSIIMELCSLTLAWFYLQYRKFDFTQLNFSINRFTPLKIIAFILIAGTVAAICESIDYYLLSASFEATQEVVEYTYTYQDILNAMTGHISFSLILFSLLNGFYEEVFFLGLIFCVEKPRLPYVIGLSLVIRFAFHTYQGLSAAAIISTLGIVFFIIRLRHQELVPFMLAHSFFDVFGLSFLLNFLYLLI